ncbi:hypothetical protein HDK90DRAFT_509386 [Phyllosticta capitalensis]|uniref:ATPase AAA-type core domain-containing protein n=1 Tax=Phyllosticta capitalensis TaxID=121624 RepID=A0ABR1YSD6_9PEZI
MAKRKRDSVAITSVEDLPLLQVISAERPQETEPPPSFYLPKLSVPGPKDSNEENLRHATSTKLSVKTLAAAIQNECSPGMIKSYIQSYDTKDTEKIVKSGVKPVEDVGYLWSVIFFAIERNSADILRILLEIPGMNPNARSASEPRLPAHVFAIIMSKWTLRDTTEIVETLLAFGANPDAIPFFLWVDYEVDFCDVDAEFIGFHLDDCGTTIEELIQTPEMRWICNWDLNVALVDTFHLSHRYNFFRASCVRVDDKRRSEMFKSFNLESILRLPFYSDQDLATELVMDNVFAHHCMLPKLTKAPLVLAFVGPTGHGQIELAQQMSKLLEVPLKVVDCSRITCGNQLFTIPPKSHQYPDASSLASFLSSVAGNRAIVVLDNFNETTKGSSRLHTDLLKVIESGFYVNEETFKTIDTSMIIWILRSTLGESDVLRVASNGYISTTYGTKLRALQVEILAGFNSNGWEDLRKPVDLKPDVKRLVGSVNLSMPKSTEMCSILSKTYFDKKIGDRAFFGLIEYIKTRLCVAYAQTTEEIVESTNDCTLQSFELSIEPPPFIKTLDEADGAYYIRVRRTGEISPTCLVKAYS